MTRKILKENSELFERILKAENYLDELGLRITYYNASEGIWIEDLKSGNRFKTVDQEMNFPRSLDTRFFLAENGGSDED